MKKRGHTVVDVTQLRNNRVVMLNKFWLCKDGDPQQAIFWNGSAQCNERREIPDRLKRFTEEKTGWKTEVVFLEVAYRSPFTTVL